MYIPCSHPSANVYQELRPAPQPEPQPEAQQQAQQRPAAQKVTLPSFQELDNSVREMWERDQREAKEHIDPMPTMPNNPFALPPGGIQVEFAPNVPASSVTRRGETLVMTPMTPGIEVVHDFSGPIRMINTRVQPVPVAGLRHLPPLLPGDVLEEQLDIWKEYDEALEWVRRSIKRNQYPDSASQLRWILPSEDTSSDLILLASIAKSNLEVMGCIIRETQAANREFALQAEMHRQLMAAAQAEDQDQCPVDSASASLTPVAERLARKKALGKPKRTLPARNPAGMCHWCERTESTEWRRGPDGMHTLCNACGIKYAKANGGANGSTESPM
ncbi:hypothetical protein OQA88_5101 [Cercophora sp. LCS_1]